MEIRSVPEPIVAAISALIRSTDAELLSELCRDYLDLVWSSGVAQDGSEAARLWQELAAEKEPSSRASKDLERLSRTADPLDTTPLGEGARRVFVLAVKRELGNRSGRARNIESPGGRSWADLDDAERAVVRAVALQLAEQYRPRRHRGRPRKDVLDTLILGFADLFARASRDDRHLEELGYSVHARFVRFAHLLLCPLAGPGRAFDLSEVSLIAVSRRWERLALADRKRRRAMDEASTGNS
ncbi:hypothetical protein [Prosthecomicrobium hirschii]|uniref:hypothetical protein n=1 Tax=Prosthecodimorpha hirschii TaxID=665126 RepID=UPI0013649F63|nr:hypothetical protein [Prosthecomicrobium hirschii]